MIPALRIAIIEDEPATARQLKFLIQETDPAIQVLATLGTVREAAEWLDRHQGHYDLLFMDIRLSDGLSLEIFEKTPIDAPVIFVTAYNDYALQAFRANGIDYILKPVDEKDLAQALIRYRRLTGRTGQGPDASQDAPEPNPTEPEPQHLLPIPPSPQDQPFNAAQPLNPSLLRQLADALSRPAGTYKQSFLVHFRDKLIPLTVDEICWFHSQNEITYAQTIQHKRLVIDFTLEQLADQLDPARFFRVNRQFIVQRKAIREIDFYFNGRLLVKTTPEAEEKMLISKARVPEFKTWMNA